jgi:adenine phosphoribosyltransferase
MNDTFLQNHIKDVPNFPKQSVVFKDISPLLANEEARKLMTQSLAQPYINQCVDVVVGIESRGFLFGMLLADALQARFVMLRKAGKLPGKIMRQEYELEYGTDTIEIQENAIQNQENVLIHDDVLATGGTAAAAQLLINKSCANVVGYSFIIELDFLKGREQISHQQIHSVLHYYK